MKEFLEPFSSILSSTAILEKVHFWDSYQLFLSDELLKQTIFLESIWEFSCASMPKTTSESGSIIALLEPNHRLSLRPPTIPLKNHYL